MELKKQNEQLQTKMNEMGIEQMEERKEYQEKAKKLKG